MYWVIFSMRNSWNDFRRTSLSSSAHKIILFLSQNSQNHKTLQKVNWWNQFQVQVQKYRADRVTNANRIIKSNYKCESIMKKINKYRKHSEANVRFRTTGFRAPKKRQSGQRENLKIKYRRHTDSEIIFWISSMIYVCFIGLCVYKISANMYRYGSQTFVQTILPHTTLEHIDNSTNDTF